MVDVRVMWVLMQEWIVAMGVRVRRRIGDRRVSGDVRVQMMVVRGRVYMGMFMFQHLVLMLVRVTLSQVQPHSNPHEDCGYDERQRQRFVK